MEESPRASQSKGALEFSLSCFIIAGTALACLHEDTRNFGYGFIAAGMLPVIIFKSIDAAYKLIRKYF